MRITKTFYHQYTTTNSTASIYVNIPFKVKTIHVKNITYVAGANSGQGGSGTAKYITILSSLVGNRPVGMVHRDSLFASQTMQDIEHVFQLPEIINGYYDFTPYTNNGVVSAIHEVIIPNTFYDSFSITMEFNSAEENF
jgi:hypothetical protein